MTRTWMFTSVMWFGAWIASLLTSYYQKKTIQSLRATSKALTERLLETVDALDYANAMIDKLIERVQELEGEKVEPILHS